MAKKRRGTSDSRTIEELRKENRSLFDELERYRIGTTEQGKSYRSSRALDALCRTLNTIGSHASKQANNSRTRRQSDIHYEYIPSPHNGFTHLLLTIYDRLQQYRLCDTLKFVDAGCGVGDKVLIAHHLGFAASGIEFDPKLVTTAKDVYGMKDFSNPKERKFRQLKDVPWIIQGDIRRHDFSDYDVIYFYCPMYSTIAEGTFEKRIWREAKLGAVVMAWYKHTIPEPLSDWVTLLADGDDTFQRVRKGRKVLPKERRIGSLEPWPNSEIVH